MNLQHCLVLTAAAGAVLMDLKTGEIANGWIVILWLAGFAAGGMSRGAVGFLTFLTLSLDILLICGNIRQRLLKFTTYFKHYILPKLQGKAVVPVPYRDGKWGMECIHFSVPILLSVLLWLGGFY